jgi:hypothetical protein
MANGIHKYHDGETVYATAWEYVTIAKTAKAAYRIGEPFASPIFTDTLAAAKKAAAAWVKAELERQAPLTESTMGDQTPPTVTL